MTTVSVKRRLAWPYLGCFAALAVFVLVTQNGKVGFEPGHHGWISSHSLAIIGHARSDTGFVGYSVRRVDDAGKVDYDYFDRSPLFFSAGMNLLLEAFAPTLSQKVDLARQAMNVVFLMTLAAAFYLLREFSGDSITAAGATLLAFSGSYFMYYKDMIHHDQPALLGIVVLLCAILRYRRGGSRRWLYAAAIFGVSLGRGYIALTVLLFWAAVELLALHRDGANRPVRLFRQWLRTDALKVAFLSTTFVALCLTYNIATEARVRGVSLRDTGIIDSAERRSDIKPSHKPERRRLSDWAAYGPSLAGRLVKSSLPYALLGRRMLSQASVTIFVVSALGLAIAAMLLFSRFRHLPPIDRPFYLVLLFSIFLWFIPMRRHVMPHEYTAIYFIGLLLGIFEALFSRLPVRARWLAAASALAVFIASDVAVNKDHARIADSVNEYTYDMERVLQRLKPGDRVYIPEGYKDLLRGRPYAPGFYLSRQAIAATADADYALTTLRGFGTESLTPENKELFLFSLQRNPR